ncbi:MAG: DUF389 domain-containing protein [Planctomycetaceae bacterium]|nr:DUF389 domain-containing protein [Planctomycetaceae bacterium]
MSTVLIVTSPDDAVSLVPWASLMADARGSRLTVVIVQRRTGETRLQEITEATDDDSELVTHVRRTVARVYHRPAPAEASAAGLGNTPETHLDPRPEDESTVGEAAASGQSALNLPAAFAPVERPELRLLAGERWSDDLGPLISGLQPHCVIVPAPASLSGEDDQWQPRLTEHLDCDVVLLRDDAVAVTGKLSIGVFLSERANNAAALEHAGSLAERFDGAVTGIYIEPAVGDDAASVGRRRVSLLLERKVSPRIRHLFTPDAVVAGSASEACRMIDGGRFDILIYGSRDAGELRRFLKASPVAAADHEIPAIAVVSQGDSFGTRQWNRFDGWVRSFVPQLSREERINLVTRIQTSSQWDFDFVCLISLATLIACLGLAENSNAVIVGAMLVAPLMTPIAGVGLGVAHANAHLTKVAFRTALRGFVTAVLIGVIFGLIVQLGARIGWLPPLDTSTGFPNEMEARTHPQFYDLLIALASGIAAAYAMGRPSLSSALPGVAIAAALVPPIATSGIALAHAEILKGVGALLLFLTNMVTIILGTSLVFRFVGIRSQKEGPNTARWPRYVLLLLVVLSVIITCVIELKERAAPA